MTTKQFNSRATGFTLIEMMIVIAIIGIVSAVAYPAYTKHVIRGNRTAAQSHLLEIATAQAQYLADTRTYACTLTALSLTTPTAVSSKYTVSIPAETCTATTFIATAVPITTSAQNGDGTLSINQSGAKLPAGSW